MKPFEMKILFLLLFSGVIFVVAEAHSLAYESNNLEQVLLYLGQFVDNKRLIDEFCHKHYSPDDNYETIGNITELQSQFNNRIEDTKCEKPSSCAELYYSGVRKSGVYTIYPKPWMKHEKFEVYCDMEADGGGWSMFQRRGEFEQPHVSFKRNWTEYERGFGDLEKEFWLGNEYIHILSTQENVELRIEMEDFVNQTRFAKYEDFEVANSDDSYRLFLSGYSGDSGDSFSYANGSKFVTYDFNDDHGCASMFKGGWWYKRCHQSNLNGIFLNGKHETLGNGINWMTWWGYYYSMKRTEMKLRPKEFKPFRTRIQ